jgi:hypothetical protein
MIVSHRCRFVFCHLPKTAGESVTAALEPHLGWDDLVLGPISGEEFTRRHRARFGLGKHTAAPAIREVIGEDLWDRYLTFAVVRHPADRLRSLYAYLELTKRRTDRARVRRGRPPWPRRPGDQPWVWPEMQAYRSTDSFSEFIRHWLLDHGELARAQADALGCDAGGAPMVDVVLRYERLEADFAALVERLGLPPTSLPHRNPSAAVKEPLTAQDRRLLAERYARDLDAFGYDAD